MKRGQIVMLATVAVALAGCSLLKGQVGVLEKKAGEEGQAFTGLFSEAVALGVPFKCTYKQADGSEGTGYVKGKKYYGEMKVEGQEGYVIMKDECMWTWNKDGSGGFTTCMKPEEGTSLWDGDQSEGEEKQAVPKDVEYRCEPTTVADSQFEPPADVVFTDLNQMMQNMPKVPEISGMPEIPQLPDGMEQ